MELSIYLARVWGLFSVLVGLGLLLNKKNLTDTIKNLGADRLAVLIAGVIALGIGAAQVIGYEVWTLSYMGLITLLGWVSLIKGAAIIFVPGYLERFAKIIAKENIYAVSMVVFIIIGAYLLYVGYL